VSAEQAFNQLAIAERSKFTGETLSNVNAQISQAKPKQRLTAVANWLPIAAFQMLLANTLCPRF